MIVHFLIGSDNSISVVAAHITAIRETNNDLVIYFTGGTQIRVPISDYNHAAKALWHVFWEGQK